MLFTKGCFPRGVSFPYRSLRWLNSQVPLDIHRSDEKYKELNTFYTEMFTEKASDIPKREGTGSNVMGSEIDELNKEFEDLYNFKNYCLSGSELEDKIKNPGRFVIQSLSHNPYYNLALEDYIFRYTPLPNDINKKKFANHRLLFYINNKCAVIGKNQIVWQELYLSELRKRNYQLLRRLSGGGAVLHDMGNVNYSFITSRNDFDSSYFNKLIVKWLLSYDNTLHMSLNKRCDILFKDKKCSGSAFKISRGKAYHHGTMLINSHIEQFDGLLKPKNEQGIKWETHSVDSVRSHISNLPLSSPTEFIDICTEGFQSDFQEENDVPVYYCDENTTINKAIMTTKNMLESDDWKYMQGPTFKIEFEKGKIVVSVEKGKIVECSIPEYVGKSFLSLTEDQKLLNEICDGEF